MDIQKDYSCLEQNSIVMSKNLEIENDFQEALPAYCDDIYRVVKCCSRSAVTSVEINYNEVKINGKTEISITYYNENSCLSFVEFDEEFSKTVNVENLSDAAFAFAVFDDKYTSFRVINQRRIDVHTSGIVRLSVYDTVKYPCISSCSGSKLKNSVIKTSNVISSDISKIEFDEEFSISSDSQAIKRIISYDAFATLTEVKVIKDKALIKAVVSLSVLYTTDSENEEIMKNEFSFNASKIININGVEDSDTVITNISVGSLYLKAKVSSGDKMNAIEAYGDIVSASLFIRDKEENIVSDGYIINRKSNCDYSDYSFSESGTVVKENKLINVSVDLAEDINEIKEIGLSLTGVSLRNGALLSKAFVNTLSVNSDGDLISRSNTADIEIEFKDFEDAVAALSIQTFDYTLNQNGKMDLRINLTVNLFAFNNNKIRLLTDIEASDEEINAPSITVYFGKENESVWEIAKCFSSDEELIKRENALNSDVLSSNAVLIIPRV